MSRIMKKLLVGLCLLPVLTITAGANAGPTYIYENPGFEMAVDNGCPIEVEKENLTFDFSEGGWGDWSPKANVTAAYTMVNPTDEDVSVTMAFPFVASFFEPDGGVYSIGVDGKAVDFDIYYGNGISGEEELSELNLNDILSYIPLSSPEEPEDGLLYTVTLNTSALPSGTERIFVRMKFTTHADACYVDGITSYSGYDDHTAEIGSWIYPEDSGVHITVFVPGGSLNSYSVAAYESYDSDKPIQEAGPDVEIKSASFREYIKYCLTNFEEWSARRIEMSDAFYRALLQQIKASNFSGVAVADDLLSSVYYGDRIAMAVFKADFLKGETKKVTVECPLGGTMERPSGYSMKNATYTYTYLSNPAKEWADFGTLNVTVVPPDGLAIMSSVPELVPDEYGRFTAQLSGLPDSNIRFVLGSERGGLGPALFSAKKPLALIFLVIAAAIIVVIVLFVRRGRNKKSGR